MSCSAVCVLAGSCVALRAILFAGHLVTRLAAHWRVEPGRPSSGGLDIEVLFPAAPPENGKRHASLHNEVSNQRMDTAAPTLSQLTDPL